jgi:tetratricopeptide (TPR) repeat protein
LFEFQDQIAGRVAGAIHPVVRRAEIELARRKPPESLRAYDLVMRAFPKLWGYNAQANEEAIATLKEALAVDPRYGRGHALLAWCHALRGTYIWSSEPNKDLDRAFASVEAASGLIDDDPTALTAAGAALSLYGDQDRATALIETALGLDPNNAWAWARFGWVGIYCGAPDKARERFERALMRSPLDPFAFNMRMGIASSLAMAGELGPAINIAREVINKHPEATWIYRLLASWSAVHGDMETARWAARKLLSSQPDFTIERYGSLPLFRNVSSWGEAMAQGLRMAGLPER